MLSNHGRDARSPLVASAACIELTAVDGLGRVQLRGVNYRWQQGIIEELDRAYGFRAIGIDAGNNGSAVAHNLKNIDVEWHERVMAFEFGGVRARLY